MAEDLFKNVQVMKGIPVNQFMETMGFFSAALGENCTGCHVAESLQDLSKFAEDVPRKRMARQMILMVNNFNKAELRGTARPDLLDVPSRHASPRNDSESAWRSTTLPPRMPNAIEIVPDGPTEPTADQVLDKYIQALGGAQKLTALTSFAAKGTIEGYDTYHMKVPRELYAKAPRQRMLIFAHAEWRQHLRPSTAAQGWVAAAGQAIKPLLPMLPGAELDGGEARRRSVLSRAASNKH